MCVCDTSAILCPLKSDSKDFPAVMFHLELSEVESSGDVHSAIR